MAIRPKTLPAAVAPVAAGTALAIREDGVDWSTAGLALAGALLLQIASNLANDLFDFEKGADGPDRTGPTRVVQSGLLSARQIRCALFFVLSVGVGVGSLLVAAGGWLVAVIGLFAILSALAYTAGPYPLGYHGWGDAFVFLFFGPIAVGGTAYVQMGHLPALTPWVGTALGALCTNILVVNNLRDRSSDARTGKRTLVVRFGERFALLEYGLLLVVAMGVALGMALWGPLGYHGLLPLISLPFGAWLVHAVATERGMALNRRLAQTAVLLLGYALLLSLGLVWT